MNKMFKWFGSILLGMGLMFSSGCANMSTSQKIASANASGVIAAVTWISYDNPTSEQKQTVVTVLDNIDGVMELAGTNSYVETVYPQAVVFINTTDKIADKNKPLAQAGSLALLTGIDLMFASNPSWTEDLSKIGLYVNAFTGGAKLMLKSSIVEPILVDNEVFNKSNDTAQKAYNIRSRIPNLK